MKIFINENYETSVAGIFVAGNVLHVHDLVDFVSLEGERLAIQVSKYIKGENIPACKINIEKDNNIGHIIPQKISGENNFVLSMRVRKPLKNPTIEIIQDKNIIKSVKMKKAIPAEMIQIEINKENIKSKSDLKSTAAFLQCADWFHERTADSEKNGGLLWQAGRIDV